MTVSYDTVTVMSEVETERLEPTVPAADATTFDVEQLAQEANGWIDAAGIAVDDGRVVLEVDVRTVRFYASLGLVDRPLSYLDRRARYGRRHLLQVVAIKRLQAVGASLADAQARLAGASDAQLAAWAVGRVPSGTAGVVAADDLSDTPAFWQQRARRDVAAAPLAVPVAPLASPARLVRELRVEIEPGISLVVDLDRWPAASDPATAEELAIAALLATRHPQHQEKQ